jgi:hypothetical protein
MTVDQDTVGTWVGPASSLDVRHTLFASSMSIRLPIKLGYIPIGITPTVQSTQCDHEIMVQ